MVGLNPWVEYEFRTVAANVIGIGEPSRPSEKRRTEEAREYHASSTVFVLQKQEFLKEEP